MNRLVFCLFVYFLVCTDLALGMTRAQLKKTLSVTKKQCMSKNGVSDDKVGDIENGNFIEDHKVMCYITCVYQMIQVVKNERLSKDLVFKQVDILYPQDMKAPVKAAVNQCIHIQNNYSDMCEGIFWSVKCLYEKDPANFVFP